MYPWLSPTELIDGYKLGHRQQYPEGTEQVYSNFTARKSRIPGVESVVFFGMQYFIVEYLINYFNNQFFKMDKETALAHCARRFSLYLNKKVDVDHLGALHDLGYLPLEIKAMPEGSLVPIRMPMWTIKVSENHDHKEFFWLVNYLETIASCILWGPTNSATIAYQFKKLITEYAIATGAPLDFVPWQGHDFSFRGMMGLEAAVISGMGHLTSFSGTDTIPAVGALEEYYGANCDKEIVGGSVEATEHSVMCAGGDDNEMYTFERLLTEVCPEGILSVVSDTWDYFAVLTEILPQLKDIILNRNGKLVIRPDSGDSVKIICGYKIIDFDKIGHTESDSEFWTVLKENNAEVYKWDNKYYKLLAARSRVEISEAEAKGTIQLLWELFGGTVNEQGFKMLDPHIGAILGDGVTLLNCEEILSRLAEKGFASNAMVFGIGSFTYQYNTRDTLGMAMKATYVEINGEGKEIFKCPKTDGPNGMKKSAKGLIQILETPEGYKMKDQATPEEEENSALQTVFFNGKLTNPVTIAQIRAKVQANCLAKK